MRKLLQTMTALLLAFVLAFPMACTNVKMIALAEDGTTQVLETAVVPETEAEKETDSVEETEQAQETITDLTIVDDLHRQYGAVLLQEGKLSADNANVTFTYDKKSDSVVIAGARADITSARISIDKEFDFGENIIGRFSIDMTAPKRTYIKVNFYLDDEVEPFFSTNLTKQKSDNVWTYSKDISVDVYDRKITGKHRLSYAVELTEKTPKNVSFSMKSVEFVKSSVPVIYFDIHEEDGTVAEMNASENHTAECYGNMSIRVPEGYVSEYGKVTEGLTTYELDYVRGRGNSTWMTNKKPYKVKLAKKADLLGMGKQKHWVLLANYYDNSLLRNKMTYKMGENVNALLEEAYSYTPASVAVDVVMNGEYYGSYYLSEQIRVGENRVDITNLEDTPEETDPTKITGGYLLSVSPYGDEDDKFSFTTEDDKEFLVECPEFENIDVNEAQMKYIQNYIQNVEDAINADDFKDADGVYYGDYMDLTSAAYYYLMQEFSLNGDGFISTSTYLYKTPDTYDENGNLVSSGKLYWGPLWDFDYVAWGSTEYTDFSTSGFYLKDRVWFSRMFEDENFCNKVVKEAWPVLKAQLEAMIADGGQLDQYYEQVKDSADYNFEKYGMSPLDYIEVTDPVTGEETYTSNNLTYAEELARLKSWIAQRIEWVDANINSLSPEPCVVTICNEKGTAVQTIQALQERPIRQKITAPSKKGYTFTNWMISYTVDYENFLKLWGITEEELLEYWGQESVDDIKANGYSVYEEFYQNSSLPLVGQVTLTPVYINNKYIVYPTKLYFPQKEYWIPYWNDAYWLNVGVAPVGADSYDLKWQTSDPSIATVSDGEVQFKSTGDVTITATCGSASVSCIIHIVSEKWIMEHDYDVYPYYYDLSSDNISLNVGSCKQIRLVAEPEKFNYGEMSVISTDPTIADVSAAGVVNGYSEGTCYLIVTYDDAGPYVVKVKVTDTTKVHTGDTFSSKGIKYKVTSAASKTVEVVGATKKTITSATIPATVKFRGKTMKVTSVKSRAFKNYSKLSKVTLGKYITKINSEAFYGCKKLATVSMGSKVEYIGSKAFYNCTGIKTMYMKSTSLKLFTNTFTGVKSTAKIYVPKKCTSYYKLFFKKARVIGKY